MVPALLLMGVLLNQIYAPFSRLPGGFVPDLALIVALFGGHVYAPWNAAALGFGAGLLQDTLTGGLLGVGALSKGLTGLFWAHLWGQIVGESPLLQIPLLAMLTILDGATFFGAAVLFSLYTPSWDTFFPLLGRQLWSNVVLGPLMLMMFAALHRRLKRPKRSSWRRYESASTFQPK